MKKKITALSAFAAVAALAAVVALETLASNAGAMQQPETLSLADAMQQPETLSLADAIALESDRPRPAIEAARVAWGSDALPEATSRTVARGPSDLSTGRYVIDRDALSRSF